MLDWCRSQNGSSCFYVFFLSTIALFVFNCVSILQYWAERRTPNVLHNLPYYGRRISLVGSFALLGFPPTLFGENKWVYGLGSLLTNSNGVLLIYALGLVCHYSVASLREINRLPPYRTGLRILAIQTGVVEVALIGSVVLNIVTDKMWPACWTYLFEMISVGSIITLTLYHVYVINKVVKETTLHSTPKKNYSPNATRIRRFKKMICLLTVLCLFGIAVQLLGLIYTLATANMSWSEGRYPGNPYLITILVFGLSLCIWYCWIPLRQPSSEATSQHSTQEGSKGSKGGDKESLTKDTSQRNTTIIDLSPHSQTAFNLGEGSRVEQGLELGPSSQGGPDEIVLDSPSKAGGSGISSSTHSSMQIEEVSSSNRGIEFTLVPESLHAGYPSL